MLLKISGAVPHPGGVLTPARRAVLRDPQGLDRRRPPVRRQDRQGQVGRGLSRQRGPRPARRQAAAGRRRPLRRRHLARRDRRGVPRLQQHRGGHGGPRRHGDRHPPRRDDRDRPLRGSLRRRHAHRHGRPRRLRVEGGRGQQLDRRAGLRQAQAGQGAAQRPLHRQRVHPPRFHRPDPAPCRPPPRPRPSSPTRRRPGPSARSSSIPSSAARTSSSIGPTNGPTCSR